MLFVKAYDTKVFEVGIPLCGTKAIMRRGDIFGGVTGNIAPSSQEGPGYWNTEPQE